MTRFNDIDIDGNLKRVWLYYFPGLLPTSKKNPGYPSDNTTHGFTSFRRREMDFTTMGLVRTLSQRINILT